MSGHILVTGATGALGKGVMASLLETMPDTAFTVLTRRPERGATHPRVEKLYCDLLSEEWTRPLSGRRAETFTGVLHMAADVRWNLPTQDALNMNAEVSARLAQWASARCPNLQRFCYVSTAYAEAPSYLKSTPGFFEHEGRAFNNSYEYSKCMGEREILARALPCVIVRPSLIVGDSQTGEIGSFNGLYTLLRLVAQGLLPIVAGNRRAYVDIVTLDTVIEAIHLAFARRSEPAGRVIWAISGDNPPKVEDLLDVCMQGLNGFRRSRSAAIVEAPVIVAYETFRRLYKPMFLQQASPIQKKMMEYIDVYTPYFSMTSVFRPAADHTVVRSPDWSSSLPKVVERWCELNEAVAVKPSRKWNVAESASTRRAAG